MLSFNMPVRKNFCYMRPLMAVVLQLFFSAWLFWGMNAGAQDLAATQQQFLRGNYPEVIRTAQKEVDDNSYRSDWGGCWCNRC